jgi:hypothetical protein
MLGFLLILVPVVSTIAVSIPMKQGGKETRLGVQRLESEDGMCVQIGLWMILMGVLFNLKVLLFTYPLILLFASATDICFYNPALLILGYHYHRVETELGTRLLIISKRVLRSTKDADFDNLRRLDNRTFFDADS